MTWDIRKEGIDSYFLEYKDKMLPFHSNVGIVNELQSSIKKARLKMIKELKEEGLTINDLTTATKTNDGKTIYDNSNRTYMEEAYINEENAKVLGKIIKDAFGMSFEELIVDMGLETKEDVEEFASELGNCFVGKTPSRR